MTTEIDWSQCPDAESVPGKMSGAWCLKGTRIRCIDIIGQHDAGCSAEEIAGPDIYPEIPLDVVRRILAFAGRAPNRETIEAMKAAERGEVTTVGNPKNLLKSLNADC
jgi:uncharacterized protein (DUF433 family)